MNQISETNPKVLANIIVSGGVQLVHKDSLVNVIELVRATMGPVDIDVDIPVRISPTNEPMWAVMLKPGILNRCVTAEKQNGKCLGWQKAEWDDEPIDQCKNCKKSVFYEPEKGDTE